MAEPIHLIPMFCLKCNNAITAQVDEVAWVCSQCGQGLLLDDEKGLIPLEVHYAAGIPAGASGKPYWVASGQAGLRRETYSGDSTRDMQAFWQQAHTFYVPAVNLPLEQVVQIGVQLLRQPPLLTPGTAAPFLPVTVIPQDMRSLAEFIVYAVEAERKDNLKKLEINLQLSEPELWIVP
jgi:hypothetical protein